MESFNELEVNIKNINRWIENNPQVNEPNVYEIADCNIRFAEIVSKFKKCNGFNDRALLIDLVNREPDILECYNQLNKMDSLRHISSHPFFQIPEVREVYSSIKKCQENGNYELSNDDSFNIIKGEAIKKALSVSFYIWQVRQKEPNYVFDNISELTMLDTATSLLESQNDNFSKPLTNLYGIIKSNSIFKEECKNDRNIKSL